MRKHHFGGFWRRAVAYGIDKTILHQWLETYWGFHSHPLANDPNKFRL